jgi:FixJ family two-component response regulator
MGRFIVEEAMKKGANFLLTQPFCSKELYDAVTNLLNLTDEKQMNVLSI